jgi:hypothetical protein
LVLYGTFKNQNFLECSRSNASGLAAKIYGFSPERKSLTLAAAEAAAKYRSHHVMLMNAEDARPLPLY